MGPHKKRYRRTW